MDTPRLTPPIPVDLDCERHLRLDARAIFQAERELCKLWGRQMNILTVISGGNLTLNDVSILLWQGLLHEDPSLTLAETQELMVFDKLPAIVTAVFEAWNAATQPVTHTAQTNGDTSPFAPSPGDPSGPSPA